MATINKEFPIRENGFKYLGKYYYCQFAIERDIKLILQEAETSRKYTFDELYDRTTLRADKIRVYLDEQNIPIYGMIIYIIDYKNEKCSRYACGGYYPFEFDNSTLMPHPYQESICW